MTTSEESLTTSAPPAAEPTRAEEQAADLLANGYTEVTEAGGFTVGQRIYHAGQRYPGAELGTATIERLFTKADGKDIEMIALRDKPYSPDDTHGFWANYHALPAVTY
ncbi:hypothetical protein [Arthrobacter sp. IK3]|uniref:hypothetical protein n=1 Tax=Arthrobacter sp. IK3 TaxID=3448169 RepID=UPI003EE09363